ncbi:MAG: glycolate oxidase subunit GlcE [Rhodospirillales bacterium CG15_BIG_FIL_POST_REV_8_21_14_020_66_15]|nr:MAG: glycolate oxidase subunit GlcE [Rhodospirillales bacterium CG15_BIG_FIL_POST_REV_8_21_14_020_66_15]
MTETLKPENADQVLDAVKWAVSEATPLEVRGSGTKEGFGRPVQAGRVLDLSGLAGISAYDPGELVLTAGPATSMFEIEQALDAANQELAFEPMDLGSLYGLGEGTGTLGGVIAANLSGPRRIKAGAARDHFLGFQAVSGRGEVFKSGGKVMKNVTGFDLSKLMAGSFGTLAVMTEVTVKVLPRPEKTRTVLLFGADDATAVGALCHALGSSFEVAGAAHLPAAVAARSNVGYVRDAGTSVTAVRVEGPGPSVEHRCTALRDLFGKFGPVEELHSMNSAALWREVRDASFLADDWIEKQVWRASVPPMQGAGVGAKLRAALGGEAFYDWGGGLVWFALDPRADAGAAEVRAAINDCGGHATLVRAAADVRQAIEVFQPQPGPLADLSKRVKEAFDPEGILNPGRMTAGV